MKTKIKPYCDREVTTLSLVDGAKIMVEIYEPKTPAQKLWKEVWLKQARKLISNYMEAVVEKNHKKHGTK